MPYRLTKIYTRHGDQGYTALGKREVSKDDLLIEAMGEVDELNATIGVVLAQLPHHPTVDVCLTRIQHDLFDLGGELFYPEKSVISEDRVTWLEQTLDEWNDELGPLEEFILPRGNPSTAACHVARTVCRRAERCLVRLHRTQPLSNMVMLKYINRLSDLLFVAARVLGKMGSDNEILWNRNP